MDQATDQQAQLFPDNHRGELRSFLERRDLDGLRQFIAGFAEPSQQIKLWALATRVASQELRPRAPFQSDVNKPQWLTLDELTAVYEGAIGAAMVELERAPDAEAADSFKQTANVLSFNFAADIAPCWPDDNEQREPRHYAAGVAAGKRMVRWRIELNKKAENFALAYWGLGIHQLGAGDAASAVDSFKHSLEHSRIAAGEYGRKAEISSEGDWSFILNSGFLGVARAADGEAAGRQLYEASLAAYAAMAEEHLDLAEDARFGAAQLEKTARLFLPAGPTAAR